MTLGVVMPSGRLFFGLTALIGGVLWAMPGCIVWDIKDQIVLSNENLTRIETQLGSIDSNLDSVNANLDSMGTSLQSMDAQLVDLQARLDVTNAHLESLRKTINNIDSTIPFLKLSGDSAQEQEQLEQGATPAEPAPPTNSEP